MLSVQVREKSPLVQCMTNFVTVNDVANILLSIGASPTMADSACEVAEIATMADALYINMGTIDEHIVDAMILAGQAANKAGTPVVLDPVGCGASHFRQKSIQKVLSSVHLTAIRGNASEIKTIIEGTGSSRGVDVEEKDEVTEDSLPQTLKKLQILSEKLDCVVAVSGAIDLVVYKNQRAILRNGDSMMKSITGAGCMVTGVVAAFCACGQDAFLSTMSAISCMNIAGERAKELLLDTEGNASFRTHLIDSIGKIDTKLLNKKAKYEFSR